MSQEKPTPPTYVSQIEQIKKSSKEAFNPWSAGFYLDIRQEERYWVKPQAQLEAVFTYTVQGGESEERISFLALNHDERAETFLNRFPAAVCEFATHLKQVWPECCVWKQATVRFYDNGYLNVVPLEKIRVVLRRMTFGGHPIYCRLQRTEVITTDPDAVDPEFNDRQQETVSSPTTWLGTFNEE